MLVSSPPIVCSTSTPSRTSWSAATCRRILPRLDQATLHAVRRIGELDPAVADRAAAEAVQQVGARPHLRRDGKAPAREQAGIATDVADDLDVGRERAVFLDQRADRRGEAGSQAAGGKDGDRAGLCHVVPPLR